MEVGGAIVPVIRTAILFNRPLSPVDIYSPILLVRDPQGPLGFLVDGVRSVAAYTESCLAPLSEGSSLNDCSLGFVEMDERTVIVLDPTRLIARQQWARLEEFQQMAQQQLVPGENA